MGWGWMGMDGEGGGRILNALHQALTRSAGAARQRHTGQGAQPAVGTGGRCRVVHPNSQNA